jgi:DNA-binding CsgD family transcriptional regulator
MSHQLLQKQVPGIFKKVYIGIIFLFLVVLVYLAVDSISANDVIPILLANMIIIILSYYITYRAVIHLLFRAKDLKDSGKQKAVRVFALGYLFSFTLMLSFTFLHLFNALSNDVLLISLSVFLLVIYGMPIFYLRRFMEMYHTALEMQNLERDENHLEQLYRKFKISKREREVIDLICEGKTNKEIEDRLFISIQTVKDHIYRIYQKTGVRNRVELTNLFR